MPSGSTRRSLRYLQGDGIPIAGSDGHTYHVTLHMTATGSIAFECDHPVVRGWSTQTATGQPGRPDTCCKHAVRAADELVRRSMLRRDRHYPAGDTPPIDTYRPSAGARALLELRQLRTRPPHQPDPFKETP